MTFEDRALLQRLRDTVNPHGIYVLTKGDKFTLIQTLRDGIARWRTASLLCAYKLGLDMRDNPDAYATAFKRKHKPNTPFFIQHETLLEAA